MMETSVDFVREEWDIISNTSVMHLSYLIQTLLPIRLVGWGIVKRHYDSVITGMRESFGSSDCFVVTGSTAEGFAIPLSVTRTNPPTLEKHADVDVLFVTNGLKISTRELTEPNDTEYKAYFDTEGLHPGYTTICLPSIKVYDEVFVYDEERRKYLLSGTKITSKLFSTRVDWNLSSSEEASQQGPALTIADNTTLTTDNFQTPNLGGSRDLVLALPCSPWPVEADGWKTRAKQAQWPDIDLVDSIIKDGCHAVAVPSKGSKKPDTEWRMSFSASEGRLAREAVTDHQRQCYVYLKILRQQVMKQEPVLSSYVFKSVFLHCCERLPVDVWKSSPGACVLYMLDVVLDCLEKKYVPTYFLPENNLVGHLTEEELTKAKSFVAKLRSDPITPIFEFTDVRVFGLQNTFTTFRELLQPLMEDMERFKQHRNKSTSVLNGILATGNTICHLLLQEKTGSDEIDSEKHHEAVMCLVDVYENWLQPMAFNVTLYQVVNAVGVAIKDLEASLSFYKALVSLSEKYPEFRDARGNLACLYHSAAYIHPEGSDRRTGYLAIAGTLFREFYEETKRSAIDFVTYLVKQELFEEADKIVADVLANIATIAVTVYSYDLKEANSLPDSLKRHVQEHGNINGNTIAFAYYYKIKCLTSISDSDKADVERVLGDFQKYCQETNDDDAAILFSYAMQECSSN